MAKSDITMESARVVIDRVVGELGLLSADTSGFIKVMGPGNKHRVYVQKSRTLGRIDFTYDLDPADPAYVQLKEPNGSIKCHIAPDLTQLERCLRMLGDSALGTQVPNKPRPFTATRQQARRPKAVEVPLPEEALEPVVVTAVDGTTLSFRERTERIRSRARLARANMLVENPDRYGEMTLEEALGHVDAKTERAELEAMHRARSAVETAEVLAEAGIEVES